MIRKLTIVAICLITFATTAFGWGGKGHDIVAEIATRHLTPAAQEAVTELLEGRSMVYYASYMDEIRSLPEYKYTAPWHYVNVDKSEAYDTFEKCPDGDVYTAIRDITAIMKENSEELTDSAKAFYVKALIHFVGDMHCPMHAGYRSDLGGNRFPIKWFGRSISLHYLWDTDLIDTTHSWSYNEWADNIDYLDANDTMKRIAADGDMRVWLDECVAAATAVYSGVEVDGEYAWDYTRDYKQLLEEQLLKGGYRLACVLNSIFE